MKAAPDFSIDGIWQLIRAELEGEPAHELLTANTVLELKAGYYTVKYAGEVADQGTFELGDASKAPTMTLRGTEGPNAGRTIPCIYQRAGDRMRVCYGLNGSVPTEFSTRAGSARYLAVYRRRAQG